MSALKSIARRIVFPAVVSAGLERIRLRRATHQHIVLCYHGATARPDFSINGRHMEVAQLDRHFAYLKKHFEVVPVADLFGQKEQRVSGKPQAAITFDDGFENNYTLVLPLLEKYALPASFYITTSCLYDRLFTTWADIIELICRFTPEQQLEFDNHVFRKPAGGGWWYSTELGSTIQDYIKKMGDERDPLLAGMMERYKYHELKKQASGDYYRMLDPDQLKAFSASPFVTIGTHTHRHYNLANIDPKLAAYELSHSKKLLEELTGKTVDTIAFPDGSYNETVKQLCIETGLDKMLAVTYNNSDDRNDIHLLPRLTISNTTTFESNMIRLCSSMDKIGF